MLQLFINEKYFDNPATSKLSSLCKILHPTLIDTLNKFLFYSARYLLIYTDSHFQNYIPMVLVIGTDNGDIMGICELLLHPKTKLLEIYNVCVHPKERRKNYCKELMQYITNIIQPTLECDLWIAVATNNEMYDVATKIYQDCGFTDNIRNTYLTPSGIIYEKGFLEMYRNFNRHVEE